MIKSKNGETKMKGDVDGIFTDVVCIVSAFCKSFSKIKKVSDTSILSAVVLAVAEESKADIDLDDLITKIERGRAWRNH